MVVSKADTAHGLGGSLNRLNPSTTLSPLSPRPLNRLNNLDSKTPKTLNPRPRIQVEGLKACGWKVRTGQVPFVWGRMGGTPFASQTRQRFVWMCSGIGSRSQGLGVPAV